MGVASFSIVAAWIFALTIACFVRASYVYPDHRTVGAASSEDSVLSSGADLQNKERTDSEEGNASTDSWTSSNCCRADSSV
jgi:hypothetical protein